MEIRPESGAIRRSLLIFKGGGFSTTIGTIKQTGTVHKGVLIQQYPHTAVDFREPHVTANDLLFKGTYLTFGCLCGVMMSLFFSQTMSGSGFPMALTASSTRVPSFTLMFLSFSVNCGRSRVSLAEQDRKLRSACFLKHGDIGGI